MLNTHISVPGSLMLLGEHSVLNGGTCLVCSINKRIFIQIIPHKDKKLIIDSDHGWYESSIDNLADDVRFKFVIEVCKFFKNEISDGIKIHIKSEFSSAIGFGSSAAVTVGAFCALFLFINGFLPDNFFTYKNSLNIVRKIQRWASGADIVASIFGGINEYKQPHNNILKNKAIIKPSIVNYQNTLDLTAVYCGYKKSTDDVINEVIIEEYLHDQDYLIDVQFKQIEECVKEGCIALKNNNLEKLGNLMNDQHNIMDSIGLNTYELQEIHDILTNDNSIYGAKISGSGLGDCIVGLGRSEKWEQDLSERSIIYEKYPIFDLSIDKNGIMVL